MTITLLDSMYRKIVKGFFPRIPSHFSADLNQILKNLLQINVNSRYSCDKILQSPLLTKFLSQNHLIFMEEPPNILLKTINFPKKLMLLSELLPKSNYSNLKTISINKKEFLQHLGEKNNSYIKLKDFDDEKNNKTKKILDMIGMKKGSVLPRINNTQFLSNHYSRYDNLAPLYEEDIFLIKPINLKQRKENGKKNVFHKISKSCANERELLKSFLPRLMLDKE